MATNSSALIVPPPGSATATNDIRGLKPLVEVPSDWAWLWWLLAAVALAALAIWAWRWWRKRQEFIPQIPVVPPHVRAKHKLEAALQFLSDPREFCFQVSDALRVYLEERFSLRAPERTTEEFLLELHRSPQLNTSQKNSLSQFLASCDLVKFARFEPTEAALRELHELAVRLVDETRYEVVSQNGSGGGPPHGPPPRGAALPLNHVAADVRRLKSERETEVAR